jgi:hypothetical protein
MRSSCSSSHARRALRRGGRVGSGCRRCVGSGRRRRGGGWVVDIAVVALSSWSGQVGSSSSSQWSGRRRRGGCAAEIAVVTLWSWSGQIRSSSSRRRVADVVVWSRRVACRYRSGRVVIVVGAAVATWSSSSSSRWSRRHRRRVSSSSSRRRIVWGVSDKMAG